MCDWDSLLKDDGSYGKLSSYLYAYSTPLLQHNNCHCCPPHQSITGVVQSEKSKARVSNAQGVLLACTSLI